MSQLVPDAVDQPRLRPLEPLPFERDGQPLIAWRDPAGIAPMVEMPHAVAVLMSLFDGTRTLADIAAEWQELTGEALPEEFVRRLVADLDHWHLLDTPGFREAREAAVGEFRAAGVRPAAHSGSGYPTAPEECGHLLDELLDTGRQLLDGEAGDGLRGLVAPHIDLARGGQCYGLAYELLRRAPADLYLVLGVAHGSTCWPEPAPLLTFTRLSYETPLGVVPTDTAFLDALERHYVAAGGDVADWYRDELVHQQEHSVEFQMLFLSRELPRRRFSAVPVLCGSPHEFYDAPAALAGEAGLGQVLTALQQAIAEYPGRVCIVAGADLSHIGPRFGAADAVDADQVTVLRARDREALAQLGRSAAAWFEHLAASHNATSVCSVANLYLLRALLPEAEWRLLHYDVAFDPEQTVSFAAAVLR